MALALLVTSACVRSESTVPSEPTVPSESTPLPVDGAVRTGRLANGVTYYVRSNTAPGGSLSLRLVVAAGGRHEQPRGSGTAHFVEHMAFNGTERFPGNELDAALRRIGSRVGPDVNASTSDSETVFRLSVDDVDDTMELAFDVLAQWAAGVTIDPAEIEAEAGVIREEERSRRESGRGLLEAAFDRAYFAGTPWQGVDVLGTPDTIGAITAEDVQGFYDTWYRPDNMAVVAVGDRPVEDLEQAVKDRFAGLEPRAAAAPPLSEEVEPRTGTLVETIVEPGVGRSFVSLDHPLPAWDLGTREGVELAYLEQVAGAILDERLDEGIATGRLDLTSAHAGPFHHTRGLRFMGFDVDGGDLVAATATLSAEIERSLTEGFDEDELERAVAAHLDLEARRLASAPTRQDGDLADAMVDHFMEGADLQAPARSTAMNTAILEAMTVERLNAHWRSVMTAGDPILMVVGPSAREVGEPDDHRAALARGAASSRRASGPAAGPTDVDVEPIGALMARPAPAREVGRRELPGDPAGAFGPGFQLRFANGARVLFVPADFVAGEVSVLTRSPGGLARLPVGDRPVATTAVEVVAASGLGSHDPVPLRRFLREAEVTVAPYLQPSVEGFGGTAAADDLEILFSMLHLWVTAPRADPVPWAQQVAGVGDHLARAGVDPGLAAEVALYDARQAGLGVVALPTDEELGGLGADRAEQIFRSRFAVLDDHVVAVVGDVDPDLVEDLARRYIGTLPGETDRGRPEPELAARPAARVERRLDVGRGAAAGAYRLNLTGTATGTAVHRVLADLAVAVLNDRLFTVVREELAATYGGAAGLTFDRSGGLADLTVAVDGDPRRLDEIALAVDAEITAVAEGRVTVADFAEARAVVASRYRLTDHGRILDDLITTAVAPDQAVDSEGRLELLDRATVDEVAAFVAALVDGAARTAVHARPGG